MTKQELDDLIIENINTNDAGLITGLVLQHVLLYLADYSSGRTDFIKSTDTQTELTDENVLTSLRVLLEIAKNNETFLEDLKEQFLSKVEDDTAQGLITFLEGLEVGTFTTGALGSGAAVKMVDGTSYAEVDNLTVRQKATFRELIIESLKHIGGQLVLTPARMKCVRVVDGGTFYKCYFDTGDGEVSNEFVAGDFARCQVFTGSGTKFYWRLVTSVGEDWINISKSSAAVGSNAPEAGDDITQLGNATDTTRQSAIILSTVGIDAPSWKQYSGIDSFSLEGKETTVFTRLGNRISGETVFTSGGANLDDYLDGVAQDILDALRAAQDAEDKAQQAIEDAEANVTDYNAKFAEIQAQVDGEISNYSYPYTPTLLNYPASDWATDIEKDRHIGDVFHNSQAFVDNETTPDSGKAWRFVKNGTAYSWTPIADSDAVKAIQEASKAQAMADGKSTTYLIQPAKYKLGDMWVLNADQTVNGTLYKQGELLTATQDSETFVQAHWLKRVRYVGQTEIDAAVVKATYWSVKASAPVIYKDAINAAMAGSHTPVTVSGELRSGTTTTPGGFISIQPNGGAESTATASPRTIAPTNAEGKTSYTVRLYDTASKTTLLDTQTIPVVFKGASGINAINASLSNEADVLPASPEGVVGDYSGSGTHINVFEGATGLTYGTGNGQYQVSASGSGITAGTPSTSGNTRVYGVASNMTADNATITFTISGKTASGASFSITKVQSFAKSRTGASAPLLYLSASAQVMKCNPDNTPQTGQTISIEAKLQNVSGTATFVATPYNDAGTALTAVTLGGSGNTRTLTNSKWLATFKRVEVVATLGSLTDRVTIYRVADGATGDTGQNAIVGLLTNESVTLQANSAGVVSSFTPANGEFWVYNGAAKVTSGITFSKVSQTGCTAAITSTGVYSVSAMSADNATVVLRAVYGGVSIDKVLTLSKSKAGADGTSITLVDVEFAKNTSPTTAPTTGWDTTAPAITGTEQLWTRTKTSYSSGNPTYSTPANITPKTGAVGQGINSVTEEYHISSSKTTQPAEGSAGWSTTQPTWSQGQYIWSRVKVVYKNPASTVYTGYAVSSEWEAINDIEIGGRNLLRRYGEQKNKMVGVDGSIATLLNSTVSIYPIEVSAGEKLIFSKTDSTLADNSWRYKYISANGDLVIRKTSTANVVFEIVPANAKELIVSYPDDSIVKIERGNKATDWTLAPEDTERELLEAQGYMKARYVRDWIQGSSANNYNNWTELKVVNKAGVNLALGKIPTHNGTVGNPSGYPLSNLTDNDTTTASYTYLTPTTPASLNYMQIDLGEVYYDIDFIHIWHYPDGRTYNGTKTQISEDGITWKTIFDSAVSGTYVETEGGKAHTQRYVSEEAQGFMRARFVRDWIKGNSTNNRNYWSEIRVMSKAGTNLAKGKTPTSDGSLLNASYATDDNIDNYTYIATPATPTLNYIQIDLGAIHYDIDYIHVWHYNGRTFNNTKTEISEDGVTWNTIFDSEISGTYAETEGGKVHTTKLTLAKAQALEYLKLAIGQDSIVQGALYTLVTILLKEDMNAAVTAGVSGIQGTLKDHPAFWAGGTYEKALAFIQYLSKMSTGTTPNTSEYDDLAKITMLHNGAAKIGDFIIEETGRVITVDPTTGKPTLVFNATDLPPINDLVNNNLGGAAVSNAAQGNIEVGYVLPNTILVNKDNSSIAFNAGSLTFNATLPTMSDRAELTVYLRRNGSNYVILKSLILYGSGSKNITEAVAYSSNGMPSGTYSIGIEITKVGSGITTSANISYSSLSWSFSPTNVRYFQFGRDGMMAFFDSCHWHFTKSNGFDLRGATNMPGVLAAGSSTYNGVQSKVWGAKSSTANITLITGGFRVPLSNMTHSNYVVQITPHTATTFRVDPAKKTNTSFEVFGTGGFDYVVIGNNYA